MSNRSQNSTCYTGIGNEVLSAGNLCCRDMTYSYSHVYLYLLVFLQTFSVLLCASTYANHGLQRNLDTSVRSPIRNKILPEIKLRVSGNQPARKVDLRTLCSLYQGSVLCAATDQQRLALDTRLVSRSTHSTLDRTTSRPQINNLNSESRSQIISELLLAMESSSSERHSSHGRISPTTYNHITSTLTSKPTTTVSTTTLQTTTKLTTTTPTTTTAHRIVEETCRPHWCFNGGTCTWDTFTQSEQCM